MHSFGAFLGVTASCGLVLRVFCVAAFGGSRVLRVFCVAAFGGGLCFVLQLFVEAVQHCVSCYSFLGLKHWTGLKGSTSQTPDRFWVSGVVGGFQIGVLSEPHAEWLPLTPCFTVNRWLVARLMGCRHASVGFVGHAVGGLWV